MLRSLAIPAALAAVALAGCGGAGGKDGHASDPPVQPYSKRSTAPGAVARASPADYRRPVAIYKRYVRRQLGALLGEVAALRRAIARGHLAGARDAWLEADARYESIGAAYGAFGDLDAAVNGRPAGLAGGVRSPDFTGLHRVELSLWHERSTRDAAAPARDLAWAVARLRAKVAGMTIDPFEYSLRAHEILEDGIHLQLSGQASPWSGSALVALRAEVRGTEVVLGTLRPLIARRDAGGALPQARRALRRLRAALGAGAAIDRVVGVGAGGAAAPAQAAATSAAPAAPISFEGAHQAGILTPAPAHAIFAAFDAIAPSRAELAAALQALSDRARRLTRGYDALLGAAGEGPTPDSGILGPRVTPDGLTVIVAFGASLFGSRYGLAARRPRALKPMTTFPTTRSSPRSATATCWWRCAPTASRPCSTPCVTSCA